MYVFTRKCGSPICHVLLTVQNTHRRALLFINIRQFWDFYTKKLASIYRHKLIVTYWALMKYQALLTIRTKLKLAIIFSYFSVAIDSGEILASV